jgi:predicted TIM-barrel fold metal-dependent hydrolase
LGIERAVVTGAPRKEPVAPCAGAAPLTARFILEAPDAANPARLPALHAEGARAVRFDLPPGPDAMARRSEEMLGLADHLAPLGWHVELGLSPDARDLARCEWSLTRLPVALCLSNVTGFASARPADDPDLAFVLELLRMGRTWLKLSHLAGTTPPRALALFVEEAVALRRDRIVWGSGAWANGSDGVAAIGGALAGLTRLIPNETDRTAVLVDNPQRLYGFAD